MKKCFKKHKSKETTILNVGIKRCDTCENNIRCNECIYEKEVSLLREENKNLKAEVDFFKRNLNHERADTIREIVKSLCEDRVSNDPVVIAIKCEAKRMGVEVDA